MGNQEQTHGLLVTREFVMKEPLPCRRQVHCAGWGKWTQHLVEKRVGFADQASHNAPGTEDPSVEGEPFLFQVYRPSTTGFFTVLVCPRALHDGERVAVV